MKKEAANELEAIVSYGWAPTGDGGGRKARPI
jgi:hypothetical protein